MVEDMQANKSSHYARLIAIRFLRGTVFLLCGLLCMPAGPCRSAPASAPPNYPVAVGTFIQWYLVKDWTDAQWTAEFRAMKDVGMEYLVFAPALDSTHRMAFYPTKLPNCTLIKENPDLVETCLRTAKRAGIKVFLGLNMHDDWWKKEANDPPWLYAQMEEGNAVADELYSRYHARYAGTFVGWYWVWEIDNLNFNTPARVDTIVNALNINLRHLKALPTRLPVMLCPFMNAIVGKPEAYQAFWTTVFARTALSDGDIFCPQDSVGAGGLKLEQVPAWFAALRKAVDTKPGLRFWSDTETFDQRDWTSAPLNRFVAQMKSVQPYVERCLTFAYSHYYSPNTVNPGYQRTYKEYVRSGKLDDVSPSQPAEFQAKKRAGDVLLWWKASTDNVGVCGYVISRNGSPVHRMQLPRTPDPKLMWLEWTDTNAPIGPTTVYAVQAYDFAGNLSAGVEKPVQ